MDGLLDYNRITKFEFYALNGNSVIDLIQIQERFHVQKFFEDDLEANTWNNIVMILDNFPSHEAKITRQHAEAYGSILFICRLIHPI
ncbi:Uncharacterised protein [uncultured archaeon]|nr:Uncharacterised protein [uncultured archaeon]